MRRPAGLARHLGWLVALVPMPLLAGGTAKIDPRLFPPADTFRTLQLAVLACSRENTAATCDTARQLADPLLDHPRLPAVCKDLLWSVRQKSVVGKADDYLRRDAIDKLARDLTVICRQQLKAKPEGSDGNTGGSPGGKSFNIQMPR